MASIKNIKQIIRENILYSVGLTKPALQFCDKLTKPHPTFAYLPPKILCLFHKTSIVIYVLF